MTGSSIGNKVPRYISQHFDKNVIIVCQEKHGTWYYPAFSRELIEKSSLYILRNRLDHYYGEKQERAKEIERSQDGIAACDFLYENNDYEYEGFEFEYLQDVS